MTREEIRLNTSGVSERRRRLKKACVVGQAMGVWQCNAAAEVEEGELGSGASQLCGMLALPVRCGSTVARLVTWTLVVNFLLDLSGVQGIDDARCTHPQGTVHTHLPNLSHKHKYSVGVCFL